MMLPQFGNGIRVAAPDIAQQILCLVPELIEIGADGQVTIGHDGPPS
jgi:hypothetical protein